MNKKVKTLLDETPVSDNDIILKHLKKLKTELEMQLKELTYIIDKQKEINKNG